MLHRWRQQVSNILDSLVSLNKLRLRVPTLAAILFLSSVANSPHQTSAGFDWGTWQALAALVNHGAVFTLLYLSSVRASARRCSFALL